MNILITGTSGFLGSHIADSFSTQDNIIGIERDIHQTQYLPSLFPNTIVRGDIRDYNFIRRVIADYEIEEIYHCAAQAIVSSCGNDPMTTYDINIMGTVTLLEAVRNSGKNVKSIVISTSDKSYGHSPVPYTEETTLSPLYTYEVSKACQQMISLSYYHNYGLPIKVVASSNIYGPGDPNMSRIIPNTITKLAKGEKARLFNGVANYVREFVYVDDVVKAFFTVAREGKVGNVYCCGGTEHLTVMELIRKICELMDKNPDDSIELFDKSEYFKEIEKQYIDASKLKSLGWKPNYSLEQGLIKSIDYYSKL